MKKERINSAIKRVKIAYGLETTVAVSESSEPLLDPETLRHQRFTDKWIKRADFAGMAAIYGSVIGYGIYKAATKVPEVVNQLGLVCSDIYQYIEPFIHS